MTDPLSICASSIAIATLAYNSCKTLCELINSVKNAPAIIADLNTDTGTLRAVLDSVQTGLNDLKPANLSPGQLLTIDGLKLPLQSCSDACKSFETRLTKLLSHSADGRTSFRDSIKLHFFEKEITAFKFRIGSYKSTLTLALSFVTMHSTATSSSAMQGLESKLLETQRLLTGQMQGLAMGLQDIVAAGNSVHDMVQRIDLQLAVLAECLSVCMSALSEVSQKNGTYIRFVEALDDSKQLFGNIGNIGDGGPALFIENLTTKDRSKAMGGNIEASVALEFMK